MTRWLWLSLALTVAAFGASLYVYAFDFERLPPQVPTHFDINGQADAWTPRDQVLPMFLLLPGVMLLLIVLTLLLPWLSPRRFEVDDFRAVYGYVMALAVALMGYLHGVFLWGALAPRVPIVRVLFGGLFLFFLLVGNVLGQVRRNFWMGVRTPWTLASDAVWIGTHRLAAWLFVGAGALGLLGVFLDVPVAVLVAVLLVAALVPVGYSLVLYKRLEREGRL